MDSMKSFKGYGKVDELEEQAFRKKTRKRIIIVVVSSVVLLAVIIGVVAGTVIHRKNSSSSSSTNPMPPSDLTPSASLKALCSVTQYPNSCFSSISSLETSNTTDPKLLFKLSLQVAINELSKFVQNPEKLFAKTNNTRLNEALKVCQGVFDDAFDRLNESLSAMEVGGAEKISSASNIDSIKTWLSTTITDQETCLDAIEEVDSKLVSDFKTMMQNSTELSSNSLAIVAKIISLLTNFNIPIHHRRLMGFDGFPDWVGPEERRLLQEKKTDTNTTTTTTTTTTVVVAKDGTGDFRTINEAVAAVPKKSTTRFVIHVKEGTYVENVVLDKNKWNVMIYGDGKDKTIVSGSKNFIDGTPTFATATFAVAGKGFIAKDIGFINTAGAAKHQAVAFRSGSDMSLMYRCSFDAFQDTLYAHSNRQFYKECDITGTIDFIFGNAAVVFQHCNIYPRQPLPNQFSTITAQGKKDTNQVTGISIQKCTFAPKDANLTADTYLGRPWKEFSTTVIMQSTIGSFLNPLGWKEWVPGVEPSRSIFYAEYQNSGPGSSVTKRVNWAGYRPSLGDDDAEKFTVASFIQGEDWLPQTSVDFDSSL
ncbi:hypothetical protein FNV43_RR08049 [Rhamnella rubrinervis]|uniref:Pectinesterase n=1 Tax=Rhamnella rubrinervis TaxID=2594499 RepID=A0A8K0HH26_9ROSA|nr:hypothetical protein FNV43_RR08049 [Rhamnella rubrinervis]